MNTWGTVCDVVAAACLIVGAFFAFAAGVGLIRFPELLARLHAATKPQVLGLILMLAGLSLSLRSWAVAATLALVVVFQLMTSPVAAHMVGRAGYRTRQGNPERAQRGSYVVDELAEDQDAAK